MALSCEYSSSQLRIERPERVQSFRLTTSTPGVVVAIENRTQNVDKQSKFWFSHVSALLSVVGGSRQFSWLPLLTVVASDILMGGKLSKQAPHVNVN